MCEQLCVYLHHCQTYQRNFLCRILDFSALRLECWEKMRRFHYSAEEDLFHLCIFGVKEEGKLPGE